MWFCRLCMELQLGVVGRSVAHFLLVKAILHALLLFYFHFLALF